MASPRPLPDAPTSSSASPTTLPHAPRRPRAQALGQRLLALAVAALRPYALVLFGRHPLAGLLMALSTWVNPLTGLGGLLGIIAASLAARLLGRPLAERTSGLHAFNGLLVGLALGASYTFGVQLILLIALASLVASAFTALLQNLSDRYLGVPVLSLPFVLAVWTALLAARLFAGLHPALHPTTAAYLSPLPGLLDLFLRSLGACFFQTSPLAGALVLAGILADSRWAAILGIIGFSTGYATWTILGGAPDALSETLLGFNLILSAIALGGIFTVLSPASILLAGLSGAVGAFVTAASAALLETYGLPALAFPFVLTTQLGLFVLVIRAVRTEPALVRGTPGTPEENLRRAVSRARRYPDPTIPVFYAPVMGRWAVTQGHQGEHTHQGIWAHALDFEVRDEDGNRHRGDGLVCEDWYAFNAPVIAPAAATVVAVVNSQPDNPIGEVDTKDNWGNLVILAHAGGVYSALCHLRQGSVDVTVGQPLARGHVIGRVGNSGRSPMPHLHFQAQRSPEVGAATIYAELLHYAVEDAADPARPTQRYVTHGVPTTDQIITPLAPEESIRRALTFAPGRRWDWQVRCDGTLKYESWESHIDALGQRQITSERATATLYADDRYTTVLDYSGPRDAALGVLALALARVPYTHNACLQWQDTPAATPFVNPLARLVHELVMPFAHVGAVPTTAHIEHAGPIARIVTVLDKTSVLGGARLPDRIEVTCQVDIGPIQITAWRDGAPILTAEVQS